MLAIRLRKQDFSDFGFPVGRLLLIYHWLLSLPPPGYSRIRPPPAVLTIVPETQAIPMNRLLRVWAIVVVLGAFAGRATAAEFSAADIEFFEKKIRPLLDTNCYSCHPKAKPDAALTLPPPDPMLKHATPP